ncbi:SPOR domain-containing protein [Rickettsiella endosymbiont of Rhagonycha lignosa]|uniref:SPOR domain-containing protein n=1 Tax=Rickettsiella endosymbiont of Rhagonycha lignosa TaxID=3077937 RepID=UPI00313DB6AD
MDFPSKRASLIIIIAIAALLVIFVPVWMKDYPTDNILSFTIPSPPVPPSAALLPMISNKPSMKNLLSYPLAPAKAWVVELPDIKDPAQAENLVQMLRRKGFNAYSRQYKSLLGVLTRVFVGPEIKPEKMKQVAEQLNTEMHLTTQVVAFDPLLSQ